MTENVIPELRVWELLKARAKNVELNLEIDQSVIAVINRESEVVYFQAKNLREVDIYISGFECAVRNNTDT